ncbi:MAG TPA: ThiF family adenylyltransferase [Propionibacteriaceae bacterium]|nr:ThiF family adenylyltransferase [Propionibacteriaceae bacterium]
MSLLQSPSTSHARFEHPQLAPYAPVIQRADDEIQVGIDPANALVFRGSGFGALLGLLNGSHPTSAVVRAGRAAGLTIDQVIGALDALNAAGLLTERDAASYADSLASSRLRLIGAGSIGSQLARLLIASGVGTLYVYDSERPDSALYPAAGVLPSRAEALRAALPDVATTIATVSHWSKPEAARLDLTIIACDRPEPDRVITDYLIRSDQPHLLVRCCGNSVSVGPLVVPGQTSCLRCADLARSDADAQWSNVLRQLTRLQIQSPPALLAWAAATAAAQTLAFLHGELPESAGSTLELGWPDFVTRLRHWPAHGSCGCGWLSHTEWGP